MNLEHRSFGGHVFRPQPEVLINESIKMFAILTPWGPNHQSKNILDFLVQNYETFSGDREVTSIFPKLQSLSDEENILRSLILACNQWIFKEQNKSNDYLFGYEMVCGMQIDNQILFAQVGHPFIYLDRPKIPMQALGHVLDLSGGFSEDTKQLPPLPSQLMGLYTDMHFSIFKLPLKADDRLIFISRNFVPGSLLEVPREQRSLDHISSIFSKENKDMSFWVGILDF